MTYASVHTHKTNSLEEKSLLQHCQHNLLSYECESMFDSVQVTEKTPELTDSDVYAHHKGRHKMCLHII